MGAALVGLAAYFWLPQLAGLRHLMARPVLIVLVGPHVLGALWHQFGLGDGVMARMTGPAQ